MQCTFNQLVEHAKRAAVMQGRQFTDPMDDWTISVLIVHPGDERPHLIRVPGWVGNDGDAKEALGWALGAAARITKPLMVALIMSTWTVHREDDPDELSLGGTVDDDRPRLKPSYHPGRREELVILAFDTEVSHAHIAEIKRRKRRPPVLGSWSLVKGGEATGTLVDPLREALR